MMQMPNISTIERVLDNEASPEEVREVTAWLRTKEGLKWLAARMDRDEKQIHLGEESDYIDQEIPSVEMYHYIMKRIRRQKLLGYVYRAAALLIPLVLFLGLFFKIDSQVDLFAQSELREIVVPVGERMNVVFQDGSTVCLNAGSKIRFPEKFTYDNRRVELEGEGYFEIAKNKKRPFVVALDKMDIRVLGTKFNVQAYTDDKAIKVALDEGAVQLSSADFQTVDMCPGEEAVYDRATRACRVIRPKNKAKSSSWRQNIFVFDQTPFDEVIKVLSRAYGVTFVVKNQKVSSYSLTMKMEKKDLCLSLDELEKVLPVSFILREDTVNVQFRP